MWRVTLYCGEPRARGRGPLPTLCRCLPPSPLVQCAAGQGSWLGPGRGHCGGRGGEPPPVGGERGQRPHTEERWHRTQRVAAHTGRARFRRLAPRHPAAYTLRLVWSCAICDVLSRSMMAYPHGISLWFSMPWQKISEKSKQWMWPKTCLLPSAPSLTAATIRPATQ